MRKAILLLLFLPFAKAATAQSANNATILFDAFGKDTALAKGWGYSALIRHNGKTILFDAGSNATVFGQNAQRLKIDLTKIDAVVVSHAHYDHLNGIDYLLEANPGVRIYFPADNFWGAPDVFNATGPDSLAKDSLPVHMRYFGGQTKFGINQSGGRFWGRNVEFVSAAKEIFPGVKLVATTAAFMGYFSRYPNKSFVEVQFAEEHGNVKFNGLPELSLALQTADGDAVFTGCSHTGVEKIVEEAMKQTGRPVAVLLGGFHLLPFKREQVQKLAVYLKEKLQVKSVAPGHCTGHIAFKIFQDLYGKAYRYAGLGETVSF